MESGYELRSGESLHDALGRIVAEQMQAAAKNLRERSAKASERVHESRKRFKEIRALLRLFHEPLGDLFAVENRWYRDAGRGLADYRDADAVVEAVRGLSTKIRHRLGFAAMRKLRGVAQRRRRAAYHDRTTAEFRMAYIAAQLPIAAARINNLSPATFNGFESLETGLARTLRDGRRAMQSASKSRDPAAFHEWRKRVKDHWYQVQLLQSVWPDELDEREKQLSKLSHILGEHHDLEVIRSIVDATYDTFTANESTKIDRTLAARQHALERKAKSIGTKIYSPRPKTFVRLIGKRWDQWQKKSNASSG
jgi:CHAD domain-containing protein